MKQLTPVSFECAVWIENHCSDKTAGLNKKQEKSKYVELYYGDTISKTRK